MEFLAALHFIRDITFKSVSIQSAFKKTELVPYNPRVVLNCLREERPQQAPRTPSPGPNASSLPITTPLTIRTLQRHGDSLLAAELSPSIKQSFASFVTGRIVQAIAGSLAMEDLGHTKAASNAQAARELTN